MAQFYRTIFILSGFVLVVAGASFAERFTVTTNGDAGAGSLRQAITDANALPGADKILFKIPPGGSQTIVLKQSLPALTDPVFIDGRSQNEHAEVGIEIKANSLIENVITFSDGSDDSVIRGCALGGAARSGVALTDVLNISIHGNYIGLGLDGITPNPNGVKGISAENTEDLVIGGSTADDRNIICHNGYYSIYISSSKYITIKGNIIGLDKDGNFISESPEQLADAVVVQGFHVDIGGFLPQERNIIGGHAKNGLQIAADRTSIINNYIGTNPGGTQPRINGGWGIYADRAVIIEKNVISANREGGILIEDALFFSEGVPQFEKIKIVDNIIGLSAGGSWLADPEGVSGQSDGIVINGSSQITIAGNTVSANHRDGVYLGLSASDIKMTGNHIGVGVNGEGAYPNGRHGIFTEASHVWIGGSSTEENRIANNAGNGINVGAECKNVNILGNGISKNKFLGIDLNADGATINDLWDIDSGANALLNFPELISAGLRGAYLSVVLNVDVDYPAAIICFFANPSAEGSDQYAQGELFMGEAEISVFPGIDQTINVPLPAGFDILKLKNLSATTTVKGAFGPGTSEFSRSIPVNLPVDFGDAPDSAANTSRMNYRTINEDGGAYHIFDDTLYLGECVDADFGSLQNDQADADDQTISGPRAGTCSIDGDDEDGIVFPPRLVAGTINPLTVTNKGAGVLAAWIDVNDDGDFLDAGEQVLYTSLDPGSRNIGIFIPAEAEGPNKYFRFRLMSYGEPVVSTGRVIGGEVEDYLMPIYAVKRIDGDSE